MTRSDDGGLFVRYCSRPDGHDPKDCPDRKDRPMTRFEGHTEGPWEVGIREGAVSPDERFVVRQGDPHPVIAHDVWTETDAHLIAAAPDLLRACEAMREALDPAYLDEVASHIAGHCQSCDSYAESLATLAMNQRAALRLADDVLGK